MIETLLNNPINVFTYCGNNPITFNDANGNAYNHNVMMADSGYSNSNNKRVISVVKNDVPLYDQGETNLCWAYCMLMRESYETGNTITDESVDLEAKRLGKKYNGPFWNAGLLYFRLGSKRKITNIETLHNYVYNYGPLYAAYSNYANVFSGHVVLVTGIDLETGIVYTNNPWDCQGAQSFEDFMNGFVNTLGETVTGYGLKGVYIP